jgi:hypothetical protein
VGPEHPVVDLADDRFLVAVVVHPGAATGTGVDLAGGCALGLGVPLAVVPVLQSRNIRCRTTSGQSGPKTCRCVRGLSCRSNRCSCHHGSRTVWTNPTASSAGTYAVSSAGSGTTRSASITGFAGSPGTEVDPTWWISRTAAPRLARTRPARRSKSVGHRSSYSTT